MKQSLQLPTRRQQGITLVELVVSIVIITIAVSGVMLAFSTTLGREPTARQLTRAMQIAQERMELILAQKEVLGFGCFTSPRFDPCQAAAAAGICAATVASVQPQCTPPAGYSVMTTPPALNIWNGDANMQLITVTVNGPGGINFTLDTLVTNY